jgi:hypothetical protein
MVREVRVTIRVRKRKKDRARGKSMVIRREL